MLPDLRNPDPKDTDITPDTIVLFHLVEAFKQISDDLRAFEQTADTPQLTVTCTSINECIDALKMFRQRLVGLRIDMNKDKRQTLSKWYAAARDAQKADNRELADKLRNEHGWIDSEKFRAIRRGELPRPD